MVPQVILSSECLSTGVAGEGSFVRVRPLVDEQVVGLGELTGAELADKPLLGSWGRGGATRGKRIISNDLREGNCYQPRSDETHMEEKQR